MDPGTKAQSDLLFNFLQVPRPEPVDASPDFLQEVHGCEHVSLYCVSIRPMKDLVAEVLYLIPRMVTDQNPVRTAAIQSYLHHSVARLVFLSPGLCFKWTMFHVDLLLRFIDDEMLINIKLPSIASLRHVKCCFQLFSEYNSFSWLEEFKYDFFNMCADVLNRTGLVLSYLILWEDFPEDEREAECRMDFLTTVGQLLFSAAKRTKVMNITCLDQLCSSLLRRHQRVDRALIATVVSYVLFSMEQNVIAVGKLSSPLIMLLDNAVLEWTQNIHEVTQETDLFGVSAWSLLCKILVGLMVATKDRLAGPVPLHECLHLRWLQFLLNSLRRVGNLEELIVQLIIQDDSFLWESLKLFVEFEAVHKASGMPCRHKLFLLTMKTIDYSEEVLMDTLLEVDVSLLHYLTLYLRSDPKQAARVFSGDMHQWRRVRVLLGCLHDRLQRSSIQRTFPFNVHPLIRSLARFRQDVTSELVATEQQRQQEGAVPAASTR